jgi:hypothetical protein
MFEDIADIAKDYGIGSGKSDFLTFKTGNNKIRIVSKHVIEAVHFHGRGKGSKPTPCTGKKGNCPSCADGLKATVRYVVWCIDRKESPTDPKEETFKIVKLPYSVASAIKELTANPEYAANAEGLLDYDVTIKKTVTGTGEDAQTEYSIIPARSNTPLTAAEIAGVAQLKDIKTIIKPPVADAPAPKSSNDADDIRVEDIPF